MSKEYVLVRGKRVPLYYGRGARKSRYCRIIVEILKSGKYKAKCVKAG